MSYQILAVHTFVAALWRVGLEARGFALFLVILVTIFGALWVGIGAGIHKHYETPTPVRYFHLFSFALCSHQAPTK